MWYIASDIKTEFLGGAGHSFFRVILPTYIIAEIFQIEHVFFPFNVSQKEAQKRYESFIKVRNLSNECQLGNLHTITDDKWAEFWGLKMNEKKIVELTCEKVYINLTRGLLAQAISLTELRNIFKCYDRNENILFIISGRYTLDYHKIYKQYPYIYVKVRNDLKQKCNYKAQTISKCIALHIRRSDLHKTHGHRLSLKKYYKVLLDTSLKYINPKIIRIISCGSQREMNSIKKCFSSYKNVEFYLNVDTIETFKIMMDTDILLSGITAFTIVIAYYSNAKIVVHPRNHPIVENLDTYIIIDHTTAKFDEKLFKKAINQYYKY